MHLGKLNGIRPTGSCCRFSDEASGIVLIFVKITFDQQPRPDPWAVSTAV